MKIKVQSKDFTVKQGLKNFMKEKTEKLIRMYDKINSCEVILKIDKSDIKNNKVCDIRLLIPGNDLLAWAQCETSEEATMRVIGALENKLKRERQKQCSRFGITRCIERYSKKNF